MDWAPYARIAARYIIGGVGGTAVGDAVLNDPDHMNLLTIAISGAAAGLTEYIYALAKRRGWTT